MKNIDFKKISLIALGLIVLFIPTYIAIANFNSHKPVEPVASCFIYNGHAAHAQDFLDLVAVV